MPYKKRVSRHKELVAQYQPVCNRKTQTGRWLAANNHQELS
jgi:hypothetical protein